MNKNTADRQSARHDHEPPSAVAKDGWRYHHIGIPTQSARPGETYLPGLKMYASGFETSPYGVQWIRFDADSPFPEIVKTVPHVAFAVDDLAAALEGKEILVPPNSPSAGVTVAMILSDGAPVELLEFAFCAAPSDSCEALHGVRVLKCAATGPEVRTDRDAIELLTAATEHDAALVAIPARRFSDEFFRLKTGRAGEILQKFVTYHVRIAVVGDISAHVNESTSLRDFVYECNRGPHIWFVADMDELEQRLKRSAQEL